MLFKDLTISFHEFQGYPGTVQDLRDELASIYGSVGAWEDQVDGSLSEVTLYDYNWYGGTKPLVEFCKKYGVDVNKAWEEQLYFDRLCSDAWRKVC